MREVDRLARGAFDAYMRDDMDWLVEHSAANVLVREPHQIPDGSTYHGPDGVIEALRRWPAEWDELVISEANLHPVDERRTILATPQRLKQAGLEFDVDVFHVFEAEQGKICRWEMFLSLEEAQAAAQTDERE
jgi:ketosteroid isomerase-like protein